MKKISFTYLLVLLTIASAMGQICNGSLGENIFTDGDFGSGAANLLSPDPQIAPGYTYSFDTPPIDGTYTITNNTTTWGWFADNWANIEDNSPSPEGYMMVVNASYEPGLFYEQIVEGLCENTLYIFSADIFNLVIGTGSIKPNISFLLDGQVVYETGDIANDEQWNTYGFSFTTAIGQTAITLALQNNAPGGPGNDLALDNITFRPCGPTALILPEEIANICEKGSPIDLEATIIGDQYDTPHIQWQQSLDKGMTWIDIQGETDMIYTHSNFMGGTYYYRFLLANERSNLSNSKCRIHSNTKIVHVSPKFHTIKDSLCTGLSFSLGTNVYDETGIYRDSLVNDFGCDSIVTLDLTIVPKSNIEVDFNLNHPTCSNRLDGSMSIDTVINAVSPFSIFVNDDTISYPGQLSNIGAENYLYKIVDHVGCVFEKRVQLNLPIPFEIDIGDDRTIELGESVDIQTIISEPATNFQWQPTNLTTCETTCETFTLMPLESTSISLSATSLEAACVASDSISIRVNPTRKVYFPNVFSPNDDGINDYFTVLGSIPNIKIVEELSIFDRWGGLIFQQKELLPNKPELGWNGRNQEQEISTGIYTYMAIVRFLDDAVLVYSGDVLLMK